MFSALKFLMLVGLLSLTKFASAGTLTIGIMQSKKGEIAKYTPLSKYFNSKGFSVKLKGLKNYSEAAKKFLEGDVDAMFSGSGLAGSLIIKDLAYPVVRPVHSEGWDTYWAVIVGPKDSSEFEGDNNSFFKGKTIACSPLASSGEFWVKAQLGKSREVIHASSHGNALDKLSKGRADYAVIKNRVWDSVKHKYPGYKVVGKDRGKNPNNTLMASTKADKAVIDRVKNILKGIESDSSTLANLVKSKLKVVRYIDTSKSDFDHTLGLLKKAGVDEKFDFVF